MSIENLDIIENSHEESIAKLTERFGYDKKDYIRKLYQEQRKIIGKGAKIHNYTHIFVKKAVEEILKKNYSP